MAKQKSRKEKLEEYELKYANIPRDYDSRLAWLIDQFKLTPNRMDEIIEKKKLKEASKSKIDKLTGNRIGTATTVNKSSMAGNKVAAMKQQQQEREKQKLLKKTISEPSKEEQEEKKQ